MKRHQVHLAIAALSVLAAACSSNPLSQRSASADRSATPASSAKDTGPKIKDAGPKIYVPATGSGAGSETANSDAPTGESTGAGAAGSGTALPNQGRTSTQIMRSAQASEKKEFREQHTMSQLLGAKVRNPMGEKIGEVQEVIIDQQGEPVLAVISTGGFLGVGDRMHAVPYDALQPGEQSNERVLNVTREQLRDAPSFTLEQRPQMADPEWLRQNLRAYPTN